MGLKHLTVIALLISDPAMALDEGQGGYADNRIKYYSYVDDQVYRLQTHFGFVTSLRFDQGERIESVQVGDGLSYKIQPLERGDVLSIVPLDDVHRTYTNMIVSTRGRGQNRFYVFDLNANHSTGMSGHGMTYLYRFHYPAPPADDAQAIADATTSDSVIRIAQSQGRNLNFDYRAAGDAFLKPKTMFDDGEKTYIRLASISSVPAVFSVGKQGAESSVNTTFLEDGTMVVHGVRPRLTLRGRDGAVVCVFNDPMYGASSLFAMRKTDKEWYDDRH